MAGIIAVKAAIETQNIFAESIVNRWLKFAAVSEKSVATYNACLKQLFAYLAENQISVPSRADLENFRDLLIASGKSAATIALYITTAKLFFRFLSQENIFPNIADNLKKRVKISVNHKKDALSVNQANKLLKSVKGDKVKNLRDRAIIALMLTTGIRSIEVVRADFCDIRLLEGKNYLFVQGKGRSEKAECVLIAPKVMEMINQYLRARARATGKIGKKEPLFVSTSRRNKGARLDTQSIRKMIKCNLRSIGIDTPTITCHSLRHTAASIMIQKKNSLDKVQMVLRHKNISTTMIYNNAIQRMKNHAELSVANVLII